MGMAFGISVDDVSAVLAKMGRETSDESLLESLLGQLDTYKIEKAALYGNDIDEQTTYAYQEIETQLKEIQL